MILKASAANGSAGSARRSITLSSPPRGPAPAGCPPGWAGGPRSRRASGWTPLFLKACAEHGRQRRWRWCPPDRGDELVLVRVGAVEVELHHLLVVLGDGLDQVVPPLAGSLQVVIGDGHDVVLVALALALQSSARIRIRSMTPREVPTPLPHGRLDHQRGWRRAGRRSCPRSGGTRADPVILVHEADPRTPYLSRLPPDGSPTAAPRRPRRRRPRRRRPGRRSERSPPR